MNEERAQDMEAIGRGIEDVFRTMSVFFNKKNTSQMLSTREPFLTENWWTGG